MLLTIAYDPAVLAALEAAFPTPPKRAKQQLDKYLDLLQREMRLSLMHRTEYARKLKAYNVRLTTLMNKSPTIGNRTYRVHEWLNEQGLSLVKNVNPDANNITKTTAILRPTHLLTVQHDNLLNELRALPDTELTTFLDTLTSDWSQIVNDYQSGFNALSKQGQQRLYFTTEVDLESLKNYMRVIVRGQSGLLRVSEENSLAQAENVLRIAQVNNGLLHQKIDKKAFGRTYYEGVSVISVSKALRIAFLGDSWEYDCKSCSTAWKMSFADEWHKTKKKRQLSVRQRFSAMTLYLEDKDEFFRQVINHVFINPSQADHKAIVKEAMTALGFGAKLSLGKWKGTSGEERQSSLYEVFQKDRDNLMRFVNCDLVIKFNEEQQTLNKYIVGKFAGDAQWQKDMDAERQRKKLSAPFSQAQKIVWLFQHAETLMMDIVRAELKKLNKTVLANVHDAIVIRERLSPSELSSIEHLVKTQTQVRYFGLGETQYHRVN
jgi:hypothetical protein